MDIFNRPPDIAEDTLHYIIYPQQSRSSKAAVASDATLIQAFVDSQLQNFLWHRDSFELKTVQDEDDSHFWTLRGTMRVGDSVDDEWCAVWLLKEISSRWDVAVSVWDSDGEFLLIEAAESLPSWVTPENSENRVWIYDSRLHLIPLTHVSPPSRKGRRRRHALSEDEVNESIADDEDFLTTADALQLLRDPSVPTLAPAPVEKTVWARIENYPAALHNHVHRTNAFIPVDIARALLVTPALVQKSVETFYTRDATQLRAAHKMARFPPHDSVLTTVKMTRPAYAQLVGQKFFPPKIFGTSKARQDSDEWRWRDTGLKIAVGFEMLFQEGKIKADALQMHQDDFASAEARRDALRQTPEYQSYIASLVSTGYFRGAVEGSQLWKELESKASSTYIDLQRPDDAARPTFSALVNKALAQAPERPDSWVTGEDIDTWLNVDAENFEDMLQKTVSSKLAKGDPVADAMDVDNQEEEEAAAKEASKLADLAAKVEKFVEGEGDLTGARFEDEGFSDDDSSASETFSDGMPGSDDEDSDTQMTSVEDQARRREDMDKLVPGIEPSEYGQMPASFHINSQKLAPSSIFDNNDEPTGPENEDKPKEREDLPKPSKPIRKPIIPRDQYDGVDSDDETDEEADADSEDEEEQPQVVGDIEVDMGEEEEEFLEFSRQALGISDDQWQDILSVRKKRGSFVPKTATKSSNASAAIPKDVNPVPSTASEPMQNPDLDSFEAVMQAMDAELARTKPKKAKPTVIPQAKGKGKATTISIESDESEDEIEAMTAELKASLGEDEEGELPIDYGLIKNFLESFKSQGGLSGPVSNLAGRLEPGWKLPRDHS